ncbi:MAG: bifunctional UDP-N-acetylglucosamine diphosphorylase/glucosamine-1-phosphate N-acetyltransferase GlmU [Alphaproteobacteria bacterium]|nr:bifunctional UDP-N-acetylglucosamine diphosphorylase/glucosamine-1-phosphate N-acetyltransferase GlmU [Alphaproteobacteria bacterium]
MTSQAIAAVILAAGQGTRMRSARPKVLHPLGGRSMIAHVRATLAALAAAKVVVVTAPEGAAVVAAAAPATGVVQDPPLGTGHAVQAALPALGGFEGDVLVLYGDTPLVSEATLRAMLERRRAGAAVVVLGFRPADPAAYGRLVTGADGRLLRIVEFREASADERAITLCNSGVMAIEGRHLAALLGRLDNANAKGEYYLTDIVRHANEAGLEAGFVEGDAEEVFGVNSRAELAAAEAILQRRLRRAALENGVSMTDPDSVHLSWDTALGRDVTIEPNVFFAPGVSVADNVLIRAFSHLEGCMIESGATVGPFARLRPGARIGPEAHIGNFVEVKNGLIEAGAKVNHLSYIGDARVGAKANVGAGTITCNYDGFGKYRTDIGAGAFIGSNTALVAPVAIGDGAIVGAGSTIAADVPAGAVALTRAPQETRPDRAERFRERARARAKAAKGKS